MGLVQRCARARGWATLREMEIRSVEAIARALNDSMVHYLVVGGLAVNVHGYERFTADIDLVIGLGPTILFGAFRP